MSEEIPDDYLATLEILNPATIKTFEEAVEYVEKINGITIAKKDCPHLCTYYDLLVIRKSNKRSLSERERAIAVEDKILPRRIYGVYIKHINTIIVRCELPTKGNLAHELQHFVDKTVGFPFEEFRAYMVEYSSGISQKDLRNKRNEYVKICEYAKEHRGERFNFNALIQQITGWGHMEGTEPHSLFLQDSVLAGAYIYPLICNRRIDRIKQSMRLMLDIHKKHGKTARGLFLREYCGIEEVTCSLPETLLAAFVLWSGVDVGRLVNRRFDSIANACFCQKGFPQETAELREYDDASLHRRALACLESIARGD